MCQKNICELIAQVILMVKQFVGECLPSLCICIIFNQSQLMKLLLIQGGLFRFS